MASGDREAPKCHVCTSPFRFGGPEPYLMPCLHSVCQTCIALDCETIFCSSCEQQFPNDGSLPKDTVEAKSVFLTTLKHRPSEVWCTNRNDSQKATTWCPQCEALLCRTCEEMHKDIKLTKGHDVIPLSSLLQEQEGLNPQAIPCRYHPELHLLLYDETCKTLICYKCKAEDHVECKSSDPGSMCDQFKESYLPEAMKQLEEKKEVFAPIEKEIKELSNILDPHLNAVKESIRESFGNLRVSLNKREKDFIEQTENSFKAVEVNTKQRLKELYLEKVRLERTLSMCGTSHDLSSPLQLLSMKSTMINRVDECLKSELPKVSKMEADIKFSNKDEEDVKHIISSSGALYSIWSKSPNSPLLPQGVHTEASEQLRACKEEKCKAEKDLNTCVDKMRNISSFVEKASFMMSFNPRESGSAEESTVKVLKTIPWYVRMAKRSSGSLGAHIKINIGDDRMKLLRFTKSWSCRVFGSFSVRFADSSAINLECIRDVNSETLSLGFSRLVSKLRLDQTEGAIELQVDMEVRESKGLIPLEDRLREEFTATLQSLSSEEHNSESYSE